MFSLFNSPDTWTSTAPLSTDRQSNEQPNQPEYQMCVSNGNCVDLNIGFCIVPIKKEKKKTLCAAYTYTQPWRQSALFMHELIRIKYINVDNRHLNLKTSLSRYCWDFSTSIVSSAFEFHVYRAWWAQRATVLICSGVHASANIPFRWDDFVTTTHGCWNGRSNMETINFSRFWGVKRRKHDSRSEWNSSKIKRKMSFECIGW